ncbi:MAG: dTDP-4-dehydrorhamnose 3,5-epimerase [Cyclobacteriaceae bacterium]|nr:dTDP-4-dehydrorhamnose 3,5-epimerase [Cyclobacteriaceae bacterium]
MQTPVEIEQTGFNGLILLKPKVYSDTRGYFTETFKHSWIDSIPELQYDFVQENQSFSKKGVVRGLHFQHQPFEQGKWVRVPYGKVLDVVVDLRKKEPTFGKVYQVVLSAENQWQLMIPPGFAHGLSALEDSVFYYKCTNVYHQPSDAGIKWNDPALKISWGIENPIVSEKDSQLPTLDYLLNNSLI